MCPDGEPPSVLQRIRWLPIVLVVGALGALPGVALARVLAPLPSSRFWLGALGVLGGGVGAIWGWTRLDRPMHRRCGYSSIACFLAGVLALTWFVIIIASRGFGRR